MKFDSIITHKSTPNQRFECLLCNIPWKWLLLVKLILQNHIFFINASYILFRYKPLKTCIHRVPTDASERGTKWPGEWPQRLKTAPYWLDSSQTGFFGKPAPQDFKLDNDHWKHIVTNSYLNNLGINWSKTRNVMDMRAVYGG